MTDLQSIAQMDIYLLDYVLKRDIPLENRILDAGCGSGRNLNYFILNQYRVTGIDLNEVQIDELTEKYFNLKANFKVSSIEEFYDPLGFDFIICSAVLHFAKNHHQFDEMFDSLIKNLKPNGSLFIRTCSDIGLENIIKSKGPGVYNLPDGTERYLIDRSKIQNLVLRHGLSFMEPLKTVNVNDLRAMTTLVLKKN